MEVWEVIRFLHVVALAFFVGGQIMLVVAIAPVLSPRTYRGGRTRRSRRSSPCWCSWAC